MRKKITTLLALAVIAIMVFSCGEKCVPGNLTVIYQTRGDYFDLARMTVTDGKFTYPRPYITINGDTIIGCIMRLQGDYVFDFCGRSRVTDIFLSLTWIELYRLEEELNKRPLPQEVLEKFILDTSPFVKFYKRRDICPPHFDDNDGILRLNELIRNGQLERFFRRIK